MYQLNTIQPFILRLGMSEIKFINYLYFTGGYWRWDSHGSSGRGCDF